MAKDATHDTADGASPVSAGARPPSNSIAPSSNRSLDDLLARLRESPQPSDQQLATLQSELEPCKAEVADLSRRIEQASALGDREDKNIEQLEGSRVRDAALVAELNSKREERRHQRAKEIALLKHRHKKELRIRDAESAIQLALIQREGQAAASKGQRRLERFRIVVPAICGLAGTALGAAGGHHLASYDAGMSDGAETGRSPVATFLDASLAGPGHTGGAVPNASGTQPAQAPAPKQKAAPAAGACHYEPTDADIPSAVADREKACSARRPVAGFACKCP